MGEDEAGSARTRSDPLPVRTGPARHRRSLASGPGGFAAFCLAEYGRNWRTRTCALAMLAVLVAALSVGGATWAARLAGPGQAAVVTPAVPAEGHVKGHPGPATTRAAPAQVSPVRASPLPEPARRSSSPPVRVTASQPPPPVPSSTGPAATATPATPAATPTATPTVTVPVPTPSLEPPPTATPETSAPPTGELPASSEAAPSGP